MRKKLILIPFFFVGMMALFGLVVMELWNWLMPELFDLGMINFWQALGILLLSKILFGGFKWGKGCHSCCGGGYQHGGHYWKHKFKNKWQHMSAEDKEKWRSKFGDKCGFTPNMDSDSNKNNEESGTSAD
ncbi:MAG: hypothetical protein MI810_12780 [Flavobacteriales bacterium]|jgi:hypothetical protein|nr:hypothetical protein [Flavobacteriales bacterium]